MKNETDFICKTIAKNIKKIREDQKLSMDQLASMSGVSKSMIGQIERAETNSSISTLWKLASGLHVPFTALIEQSKEHVMRVDKESVNIVKNEDGLFRMYPYFPIDENRNFEILYIELDPGACSHSEPHATGTEEYIIVFGSTLELTIGEETHEIHSGDAIYFTANEPHSYRNNTEEPLTMINIISYA
ncbi:helix-turn-helix domain-containing protein [Aedoeadaptatus urinae]|uniref:helix-turn-helix domain-containing protein n=1 Tax=Aedoeadaptatus urinae TaxID=1871017 RepID=UPI00097D2A2B|nr:XRE family transcriptional regulator [Peptoniphilus urinae]